MPGGKSSFLQVSSASSSRRRQWPHRRSGRGRCWLGFPTAPPTPRATGCRPPCLRGASAAKLPTTALPSVSRRGEAANPPPLLHPPDQELTLLGCCRSTGCRRKGAFWGRTTLVYPGLYSLELNICLSKTPSRCLVDCVPF